MDQVYVPDTHIRAGREYLVQLRKLGLKPEGVFWGQWDGSEGPNLLIVTSLFDRYGPLKISELLLRAYSASALPQEIDPFIVELHSPEQSIIRDLMSQIRHEPSRSLTHLGIDSPKRPANLDATQIRVGHLTIPMRGLYMLDAPTMTRTDQHRTWTRFRRTIDALAA